MENSFGVCFIARKARCGEEVMSTLYLRITADGISREVSTKRKFRLAGWNKSPGRFMCNTKQHIAYNKYLEAQKAKVCEAKLPLMDAGQEITADNIKKAGRKGGVSKNIFLLKNTISILQQ